MEGGSGKTGLLPRVYSSAGMLAELIIKANCILVETEKMAKSNVQRAIKFSVDRLRAAFHTTFHPTSCVIFATKGALSTTTQLASSKYLPILKMISLRCRLETPSLTSFSSFSVTLVPKALFSSLHSFTKHSAFTSSPIVTKALLPTLSLSLQTPTGGGSSTSAQLLWLSL